MFVTDNLVKNLSKYKLVNLMTFACFWVSKIVESLLNVDKILGKQIPELVCPARHTNIGSMNKTAWNERMNGIHW